MALNYLTFYERYQKSVADAVADPLAGDVTVFKQFDVVVDTFADRCVRFIITTSTPDRENDVVVTDGIDTSNYEKNGVVMWAHDYKQPPIGRCVSLERSSNKIIATVEFMTADMNPFAEQIYRMVKAGFVKACSIGFRPTGWDYDDDRGGVDFKQCEMLEFSICPIPANAEALIAASAAGIDTSILKDWARRILAVDEPLLASPLIEPAETIRWNRSLSKSFDVTEQRFPARSIEQDLAAKYCGVMVKDLYHRYESVASTRMGAFLYALDETIRGMKLDDLRNVGADGKEEPPLYEYIQLNSTTSGEYVIDGLRFLEWNGTKIALRVEPRWYGLQVTTYVARKDAAAAQAIFAKTFARAKELNFLKGEAFSLSGEFIKRGTETFDDVFLSAENQTIGKRLLKLIDEHGATIENRGVIMLGPPGNGKTLLGRILMNSTKSTFVWCSARDFYYSGGFNGLAEAFEIGRESAAAGTPAILFIEDVDNYLDGHTTDLMKTEMDGIAQSKGVVTILTTNYPELLPKALIDRPGRFHDVLRFDLPDATARLAMLRKWMPDLVGESQAETVKALHGYSGAHVREFARFASIIRSQDGVSVADAAKSALAKLKEQRDLIASVSANGSRYRAPSAIVTAAAELLNARTKEKPMPKVVVRLAGRRAELLRDAARTAADSPAIPEPFCRDLAGWKAFTKARDRAERKSNGEALPVEKIAELLDDYGFDAESAILREQIGEPDGLPAEPPTDPGEEVAELVGYETLASLLGQAQSSVGESLKLAAALIAAETDEATETAIDEAAEEAVEEARLDAIVAQATQAASTLAAVCDLISEMQRDASAVLVSYPTMSLDEIVAKISAGEQVDPAVLRQAIDLCEKAGLDVVDRVYLKRLLTKSGRVLSKKNEGMLQKAMEHSAAASDHVKTVLDSVKADMPDDETETDAVRAANEPILILVDDEVEGDADDAIVFELSDDVIETRAVDDSDAVIVDVDEILSGVREIVAGAVKTETRAAIDKLRGRIHYD